MWDHAQSIKEERHLDNQALEVMQQREQRTEKTSVRIDSAEHWSAVANQRAITAQEQAVAARERTDSAMALAVIRLMIATTAVQTSTLSRPRAIDPHGWVAPI